MTALPDVNVLIALAWPNHVHHGCARRWFREAAPFGWATCPFTQCGFTRVSSNPSAVKEPATPAEALAMLRRITRIGRHEFWPDDLDLTEDPDDAMRLLMGHRQVSDAYLLRLAARHGGRLVTFDRAIPDLIPGGSSHNAVTVLGSE